MILIVGLGNVGEEHQKNRHNLGFMVLDDLLAKITPVAKTNWQLKSQFKALVAKVGNWLLVKPQTFMNSSGFAVAKIVAFYHLLPEEIWVVHDDLDLVLGKIKIRQGGGSAGHRGVQSIIDQLSQDQFHRIRLGVGRPGAGSSNGEVESYVLSSFSHKELGEAKKMIKKTIGLIKKTLD